MAKDKYKEAFRLQKLQAGKRGIGWNLTFEQWLHWWGSDIDNRGVRSDQLQMQRLHDDGPYELGNIVKGHPKKNVRTAKNCWKNKTQEELAREHQARLDAMIYEPSLEPEDEGMDNIYDKEMRSNGTIAYAKYAIDK